MQFVVKYPGTEVLWACPGKPKDTNHPLKIEPHPLDISLIEDDWYP